MKRILVPVDFSGITAKVLRHAVRLAEQSSGRLWLLHVASPDPEFVGFKAGPASVRREVAHRFRTEHRRLQARAANLRKKGLKAEALLVQGPTVAMILKEAVRLKCGLIVMGSHSHGTLHRVLMGSVTEGVVRKATCPILLVK